MPQAEAGPRRGGRVALVLVTALLAGAAAWLGLPEPPAPAPPEVTSPAEGLGEADEAAILALRPAAPVLLRLAGENRVFVLVFPDLAAQAATMNRVAALVEKAGFPRDRLATAEELSDAIAARGETPATWYMAHDYRGSDLAQFFQLAERRGQVLATEEAWLRTRLEPFLAEGEAFALLTMAATVPGSDEAMRLAVLRHEVSHGRFFTRPGFAARVMALWREALTDEERAAFVAYLEAEGYDIGDERLMANEAMAYLAFTQDIRLFKPASIGLSPDRAAALRLLYQRALE